MSIPSPAAMRSRLVEFRGMFAGERRLVTVTLAALAVVSACSLAIAKLLDDVLGGDDLAASDPRITDWVVRHRTSVLTSIFRTVTHLGDPWVIATVVTAGTLLLLLNGQRRLALFLAASSTGTAIATTVAKLVVDRPRPPLSLRLGAATGAAFPSGHSAQSVACYSALAVVGYLLVHRRATRVGFVVAAAVIALIVGMSRVYLAVHWSSDVLCGWSVAGLWLATLLLVGWARPRLRTVWVSAREPAEP